VEAPARHFPVRSQAEERAIQRFVERALRNYDHAKALTFHTTFLSPRSFRSPRGFMFCPKCSSLNFSGAGEVALQFVRVTNARLGKDATTAKVARSGKEKTRRDPRPMTIDESRLRKPLDPEDPQSPNAAGRSRDTIECLLGRCGQTRGRGRIPRRVIYRCVKCQHTWREY